MRRVSPADGRRALLALSRPRLTAYAMRGRLFWRRMFATVRTH